MRCLDCGNKAKKDCMYYRCRTCCKNRGFRCQTHIKSTWVPVSTRQILQNSPTPEDASTLLNLHHHHHHHHHQEQHFLNLPSSSGLRDGDFPAQVTTTATFVCVRVASTSSIAAIDQYAYQTSVNIGGHIFKGILYDQGPHDPMVMNSYEMNMDGGDHQNASVHMRSELPIDLLNINNSMASASSNPPSYSFLF